MKTIHKLRKEGYKVRVIHERIYKTVLHFGGDIHEVSPRGGTTIVELTTPGGERSTIGVAECSTSDNYNRKDGSSKALRRAIVQLEAMNRIYGPINHDN